AETFSENAKVVAFFIRKEIRLDDGRRERIVRLDRHVAQASRDDGGVEDGETLVRRRSEALLYPEYRTQEDLQVGSRQAGAGANVGIGLRLIGDGVVDDFDLRSIEGHRERMVLEIPADSSQRMADFNVLVFQLVGRTDAG